MARKNKRSNAKSGIKKRLNPEEFGIETNKSNTLTGIEETPTSRRIDEKLKKQKQEAFKAKYKVDPIPEVHPEEPKSISNENNRNDENETR